MHSSTPVRSALLLGLLLPTAAWCGLAGNLVQLDYLYPESGTSIASVQIVAPFDGLTYTCCLSNEFMPEGSTLTLSATDNTIVIVGDRSQVFTPAAFNGLSFLDVLGTIEPITGVTLTESTLPGFDTSDISFTTDQVLVNFAGANGLNLETWRVALLLSFGNDGGGGTVPSPGTLALGALGLLGIGGASRLRRSGQTA